jgi:hypothetical protein
MPDVKYTLVEESYGWKSEPDFHAVVYPAQAEFIYRAGKALTEFRSQWMKDHQDDGFAKGLEMDLIPVMTDGMVMGFMVVSEINGESYDYAPDHTADGKYKIEKVEKSNG